MSKREDYEHRELDYDYNSHYYETNKEVMWINKESPLELQNFRSWFKKQEENCKPFSLFYLGTALYFTYKEKKYRVSWTWYTTSFLKRAINKLKKLGSSNIQINYGRLD